MPPPTARAEPELARRVVPGQGRQFRQMFRKHQFVGGDYGLARLQRPQHAQHVGRFHAAHAASTTASMVGIIQNFRRTILGYSVPRSSEECPARSSTRFT